MKRITAMRLIQRSLGVLLLICLFSGGANAAVCTVPFTFVNGTTADGGQVSSNFTSVLGCINNFGSAGLEITGGDLILDGANSGKVTIHPQANAGTYNWNLPTTAGTLGQLLQSGGGGITPMSWTTTTFPATVGINQLLYGSASNVISGLATANNGTLVTSNTGVPSILVGPGAADRPLVSQAAAAPIWSKWTLTAPATAITLTGTDNQTYTLPATTDTLVGRASTDTMSNKTFVAPVLGAATATSINKYTFTQPAGGATLTIADGKTLTDTSAIGTKLLLGDAGGAFVAYAGTSCTNQAATALSTAGAATCSSITNAFLTAGSFTSITGVGTLTAGIWNATVITGTYGGTGVNNGANTLTLGAGWTLNGGGTLVGTAAQTYTLPTTSKTLLATDFSNVGAVQLGLAAGGTNNDLSGQGGSHQVVTQNSVGAPLTVRQLACADLSDASSNCSTGTGFKSMIYGSSLLTNTNNAAVRYIGLGLSATEALVSLPVSFAGTVKNLHVIVSALCCGAGAQYVFTVRQGVSAGAPADTTLTCTISTASTVICADTTAGHAFAVAANDTLDLSMTPSGAPTAVAITGWSVEIDPL